MSRISRKTGIDTLAPALGSVHGPYKGEPKLGFKEMEEIGASTGLPITVVQVFQLKIFKSYSLWYC